jgi:RND family efflux transporter MFP subunit
MMMSRTLWVGFLITSAVLLAGCGEAPAPEGEAARPLRVIRMGELTDINRRAFPGRAAALQEVNLSFRVGGPLTTYPVKVGDKVDVGDVVAQIDPNDFQVTVRNVQGELERAGAELVLAEKEYQRAVEANAKNSQLISESELDRRLSGRDRSRANVKALEATLQAARDELDYSTLRAPFKGTIVNTYVENFETVRAEQPIVRLLDNTRVEFKFSIPETLITLLATVRNINVRFDAFPDLVIAAEIEEVGTEASQVTRTYPVTLIMDQPEGAEILPGMAGRASGEAVDPSTPDEPILIVPVDALFSPEAGGSSFVWVVDESQQVVSRREVSARRLLSGGMEIESGLEVGELVAVAGVHFLEEGQAVRPVFD